MKTPKIPSSLINLFTTTPSSSEFLSTIFVRDGEFMYSIAMYDSLSVESRLHKTALIASSKILLPEKKHQKD